MRPSKGTILGTLLNGGGRRGKKRREQRNEGGKMEEGTCPMRIQ